jgi:hypothetical protein
MPKRRQGNVRDDASAVRMPALQQWWLQGRQGNGRKDVSAATVTMPKWRQGDICNNVSAAMTPAPQQQQW